MSYFYSLTPDQVEGMDWETSESLWQGITIIEAQDALLRMRVADYPNMKKQDREKMHREIHKMAYPRHQEERSLTVEDLARMLNG